MVSFLYLQEYEEEGHIVSLGDEVESDAKPIPETRTESQDMQCDCDEDESVQAKLEVTSDSCAFNNFRVYIAAEKFGLQHLKILAASRLSSWFDCNWDSDVFVGIFENIVTLIHQSDRVLLPRIARVVSNHIPELIKMPGFDTLMSRSGMIGLLVITRLSDDGRIKAPSKRARSGAKSLC